MLSPATNLGWSPASNVSCVECVTTILTTTVDQDFLISGILLTVSCLWRNSLCSCSGPNVFGITVSPADNGYWKLKASVENPGARSYQWKINGRDLGTWIFV
ncbi:MAG: hypothetical protein IPN87_15700 [Saprospiraceae bacterium]|nr:hypothetical protein [Candidatus Brachybacter algidus]